MASAEDGTIPFHRFGLTDLRSLLTFARLARWFTAMVGLAVLCGWAFDLPRLRSLIPGAVEMKANTAVALTASAFALWMVTHRHATRWRPVTTLLSVMVALLGATTLCEYAFDWNPGLDEFLFLDTGAAFNQARGRMSPYSAAAFVALGCAICSLPYRRLLPLARTAGGFVAAIGIVSLLGYLWNVSDLVTDRVAPPVAVHTACGFVLLGIAIYQLAGSIHTDGPLRARTRLESLVLGGFIPTALFVLMGGGFTYTTGANFADTAQLVAHTQEVRAELGNVYSLVADTELARRNQMLSANARFETEFQTRAAETRASLGKLRQLVVDNPDQLLLHQRLAGLIDTRLQLLESLASAPRQQAGADAAQSVLAGANGATMAQIRAVTQQMEKAEAALLASRLERARSQRRFNLMALLATLAVLTGVFVLLFRSIRREVLARAVVEDNLQRTNAELDQRVSDRTRQLEAQQSFLRRVIDLNRNYIFAKDVDGRFVLVNAAMAESYGTTVDELVGRSDLDFNPDADQVRQFRVADLQVLQSGQDLVIPEEALTNAAGELRWVSTVKRPMLSIDGSTTILLGVCTDITERKRAEDGLRHMAATLERRVEARTLELKEVNRQLELARTESDAASRAKSSFLANMSHEIRTPMNAIIGLAHLMTRETLDRTQRGRLDKIGNAAQHLLHVINDILDISKIEAGKLTLDDAEFSLDALMTDAIELVAPQGRAKGLEIILDQDHLPNRLRGDSTRLSQILINLLTNAVKFTEHGWVRLRGQMLEENPSGLRLRFEVQDTGPGISIERQGLLFSTFEQADNSSSRRHGGTGLGLALSRQLARAMGGDAGVQSAPGSGSVFWFTAWLARGRDPVQQLEPVNLQGLRALLVDDLPEALAVIDERLRGMGMYVDALDSGAAAIRKVEAEMAAGRVYDVMLIDWRMDPMDGLETLAHLRAMLGDGVPPSILVTAFDEADLARRARRIGFDAVLLKPIPSSALLDQLTVLLRRPDSWQEPAAPAADTPDGESLLKARHAGQRILLAEDNPINREVAQDLLTVAGLVVETAWDGARAVEMALSRRYDLILMDVQMPVMDGLEATRAIRRAKGQTLPIIAMTANAFADDRQACLDAGMNDHVPKPVNPQKMFATLLRWLPLRELTPSAFALLQDEDSSGATGHKPLRERLAEVEGFDIESALVYVSGHMSILERALRQFVATYKLGLPELLNTGGSEGERVLRWRAVCHSARGALTTIGAAQLVGEITEFERRIAASHETAELASRAGQLHADLLHFVQQLADELAA